MFKTDGGYSLREHQELAELLRDRQLEVDGVRIPHRLRRECKAVLDHHGPIEVWRELNRYVADIRLIKPFMDACRRVNEYNPALLLNEEDKPPVFRKRPQNAARKAASNVVSAFEGGHENG